MTMTTTSGCGARTTRRRCWRLGVLRKATTQMARQVRQVQLVVLSELALHRLQRLETAGAGMMPSTRLGRSTSRPSSKAKTARRLYCSARRMRSCRWLKLWQRPLKPTRRGAGWKRTQPGSWRNSALRRTHSWRGVGRRTVRQAPGLPWRQKKHASGVLNGGWLWPTPLPCGAPSCSGKRTKKCGRGGSSRRTRRGNGRRTPPGCDSRCKRSGNVRKRNVSVRRLFDESTYSCSGRRRQRGGPWRWRTNEVKPSRPRVAGQGVLQRRHTFNPVGVASWPALKHRRCGCASGRQPSRSRCRRGGVASRLAVAWRLCVPAGWRRASGFKPPGGAAWPVWKPVAAGQRCSRLVTKLSWRGAVPRRSSDGALLKLPSGGNVNASSATPWRDKTVSLVRRGHGGQQPSERRQSGTQWRLKSNTAPLWRWL